MIGIDTNILVRYIVQDDPVQAAKASHLIESSYCTLKDPGMVEGIALCELVWVLESAYGYSRELVARVVRQVLGTAELTIEAPEYAWAALAGLRIG